jgi:hypothetical protein
MAADAWEIDRSDLAGYLERFRALFRASWSTAGLAGLCVIVWTPKGGAPVAVRRILAVIATAGRR